jgi:hypothetical protein
MIIRIAASFLVILGIGAILLANETVARSGGGFAGGRSVAPALHPQGTRHFVPFGRAAVRSHAFRNPFFRHRRFGFGSAGAWGWPWYGSYYDSTSYGPTGYPSGYDPTGYGSPSELAPVYPTVAYSPMGSIGYPAAGSAPTSVYVIPYRPGCDSQTQKLPWRDGGERSITIVRC